LAVKSKGGFSAANDGIALPLLYLPLTVLAGRSLLKDWLLDVIVWKVLGSLVLGAICGRLANRALRFSESHGLIDKESFVVFSLALSVRGIHSFIRNSSVLYFVAFRFHDHDSVGL
jgi:NhaP-type Na+/H+ or K+/H+ antiporter